MLPVAMLQKKQVLLSKKQAKTCLIENNLEPEWRIDRVCKQSKRTPYLHRLPEPTGGGRKGPGKGVERLCCARVKNLFM